MTQLEPPDWNRCPGPAVCFALHQASESSRDALIVAQAQQLDRLTGGYQPPAEVPVVISEPVPEDVTFTVEALMAADDIFRKPARVAAPRLVERLAAAGITLTREEPTG